MHASSVRIANVRAKAGSSRKSSAAWKSADEANVRHDHKREQGWSSHQADRDRASHVDVSKCSGFLRAVVMGRMRRGNARELTL